RSAGGSRGVTVSVTSYINPEQAQEEAARLRRQGLEAFVQPKLVGRQKFHRVCVGRFQTESEADRTARQLHQDGKITSFRLIALEKAP
ncbi:MAG: SPOR domain-containing protein, partial [Thermodesulfobacteriota bacterium]